MNYRILPKLALLMFLALPATKTSAQINELYEPELPVAKREVRGVWLTTLYGLDWPKTKATNEASRERQKAELCHILDQLKACGINTIFLQTRVRGSVIYPSQIEPWDVCLTGSYDRSPGYDPLLFAIEETHRRGMELHAWVVAVPAFKAAVAGKMGKKSLLKTNPKLIKKVADGYYLDPAQKASADYLSRICQEIVKNYDVDGIHFDYIRYPADVGQMPDDADFRKSKAKNKAAWRRDNMTRMVRQAYTTIKALKPWVRVSCAPIGKYNDMARHSARGWSAYGTAHQDAQAWLRDGIMDMLVPMMYFQGEHFYPFAADWQERSYGRTVVPGLGIYFLDPKEGNWTLDVIQRELAHIRREGLGGQAYFRSHFLTSNPQGLYDYIQSLYYPYPALLPAMTWQDNVAPEPPVIVASERVGATSQRITWRPQELNAGGCRYAIYASRTAPVDISDARNLVCITQDCSYTYNLLTSAICQLHLAITAIDRCGNESEPVQVDNDIVQ